MDGPRYLTSLHGCLNPLCPRANWSEPHLPRWWLRLDDGQIAEFTACDETCAQMAVRFIYARLGRSGEGAPLTHAREAAAAH